MNKFDILTARIEALNACYQQIEQQRTWYCEYDDEGKACAPDEFSLTRYKYDACCEALAAIEKLAGLK